MIDSLFFILKPEEIENKVKQMGKAEKLAVIVLGLFTAFIALWKSNDYFISTGVAPEIAAGYSIIVFLGVLGAFGLIAFKVNL
jgi:hypothetical protein